MERWLLISNCQTHGLARAFQMVNSNFEVTPVDIWSFIALKEEISQKFSDYFRVLVSPEVETISAVDFSDAPNLTRIPGIQFTAYQPDCAYAGSSNGMLHGPMEAYHSLITIAAFNSGMSAQDAVKLFNGNFYERIGYMDFWIPQRDRLVEDFKSYGIDISQEVRRWGRQDCWMHTIDHPKMIAVHGVARAIMRSMGVPDQGSLLRPEDNLFSGNVWPVYPEIGEMLGVEGSMRFKRFNDYHHIDLEQLISESYALYANEPAGSVLPIPEARETYSHILEAIG